MGRIDIAPLMSAASWRWISMQRRLAAALAVLTCIALLGSAARALASSYTQPLMPDPDMWCVKHEQARFETQIREAGWTVQHQRVIGTKYKNDWKCSFWVTATAPAGSDSYQLPPVRYK